MFDVNQPGKAQLLIVDDDPFVRDLLSRWLRDAGYACATADNTATAWERMQAQTVDAVTLDVRMPGGSGFDLLDQVRQAYPETAVLMVTGEGDAPQAIRALTLGAFGYLIKPVNRAELIVQLRRGLAHRRLMIENRGYLARLEERVREQTRSIRAAHEETIHRLLRASVYRDYETGAHIRRTGWYSELLATAAGWDAESAERIRLAAPMHDVGKIGIPDAILRKPGPLTPREVLVIQSHTTLGAEILCNSQSQVLRMACEIARCHHEYWDGTGYPAGLAGDEIPEAARIVAIVDVYDALTHDRVYRAAFSEATALKLMAAARGTHFDPRLFDLFLSLLPEMRAVAQAIPEDMDANAAPLAFAAAGDLPDALIGVAEHRSRCGDYSGSLSDSSVRATEFNLDP